MRTSAAATLAASEINDVGMSTPALGDEQQMTATDTEVAEAEIVDEDSDLQRAIDEATLDGTKPTEMVHIESRSGKGFLTIDPQQTEWTEVQLVALKSIGIETAGPDAIPMPHVLQFLYACQMRDLDPWLREAYLIVHGKIWFKDNGQRVDSRKYTLVTGIDGFRKRSEDSGQYAGQVGPEWCGEDGVWKDFWIPKWGHPEMARVGILRKGNSVPTWGVAAYDEFVPLVDEYMPGQGRNRQKTGRKVPTDMWTRMAANQLAKCAEAQGHRKASPRQMSGLVIPEEMERAALEYQQDQETERQRELATRRHEAHAARAKDAPVSEAVLEGEIVPNAARAAEPVSVGESARAVVDGLRADARVPRGGSRAPGGAARAGATAEDSEQRAWLMAEIEMLAELWDRTPGDLLARQAAALGKEPRDFTAQELLSSIKPLRAPAASRMRALGRGAEAASYETAPSDAIMPLDDLLGRPGSTVDPSQPHPYVDKAGVCRDCDRYEDEKIHPV